MLWLLLSFFQHNNKIIPKNIQLCSKFVRYSLKKIVENSHANQWLFYTYNDSKNTSTVIKLDLQNQKKTSVSQLVWIRLNWLNEYSSLYLTFHIFYCLDCERDMLWENNGKCFRLNLHWISSCYKLNNNCFTFNLICLLLEKNLDWNS